MWVLISLVWVFRMILPILMIRQLHLLKDMNMEPGDHMMKGLQIQNESGKIHAAYQMSEPQLQRRKISRPCRKKKQNKNIDKKGATYKPGTF